jgi:hypothetical protein
VKLARFRKSRATGLLSSVGYRPNTNTSNVMKNSSHQEEVIYESGKVKERN